jgi:hypothetical protein
MAGGWNLGFSARYSCEYRFHWIGYCYCYCRKYMNLERKIKKNGEKIKFK